MGGAIIGLIGGAIVRVFLRVLISFVCSLAIVLLRVCLERGGVVNEKHIPRCFFCLFPVLQFENVLIADRREPFFGFIFERWGFYEMRVYVRRLLLGGLLSGW